MRYKNVGKPARQTIIKANSKEEAIKTVNNPDEIGLTAEIKEIRTAKRIPKGWMVSIGVPNGFPITAKTNEEISLEDDNLMVSLSFGSRNRSFKVKDIVGAYKPGKDKGVVKRGY
jgi:hypothetical protein